MIRLRKCKNQKCNKNILQDISKKHCGFCPKCEREGINKL